MAPSARHARGLPDRGAEYKAGGRTFCSLIKSARKKELLLGHDQMLATNIEKIMSWVAADRSERGDTRR
jgi:hypothetical protein